MLNAECLRAHDAHIPASQSTDGKRRQSVSFGCSLPCVTQCLLSHTSLTLDRSDLGLLIRPDQKPLGFVSRWRPSRLCRHVALNLRGFSYIMEELHACSPQEQRREDRPSH